MLVVPRKRALLTAMDEAVCWMTAFQDALASVAVFDLTLDVTGVTLGLSSPLHIASVLQPSQNLQLVLRGHQSGVFVRQLYPGGLKLRRPGAGSEICKDVLSAPWI